MRLTPRQRVSRVPDVDITSMIDVVFLLIVFFMTTAQFARMTKAEVDLPDEKGLEGVGAPETSMIVNVIADGTIVVDSQSMDMERFTRLIDAEVQRSGSPGGLDIVLRVDQHIPSAQLNEIARVLMDRGVRTWRLATDPSGGGT
ncbi:MAG: ExbD/TolR family protein [Phycisphaerales bacterium JB043]